MKRNFNISEVKDIWCGYKISGYMKERVLNLTMKEFDKPVHERRSAYMLIMEARESLWVH